MTVADRKYVSEARMTGLILLASVVGCLVIYYRGGDAETLELWIVRMGAPATSLFVLLYGFTVRWWEFWIGRALMVSSTGMAALCDLALLNRTIGPTYALAEPLLITVLVFISMGGVLKLVALLVDKVPLWTGRRPRRLGRHARP